MSNRQIEYDETGRPYVRYCPLCGITNPGGIWGTQEIASILSCRGCEANVLVDIGPARRDDGGGDDEP